MDDGCALYNWHIGQRFEINREQIVRNLRLAANAIVVLKANIPHLVGHIERRSWP
jgi:hypothetical protein